MQKKGFVTGTMQAASYVLLQGITYNRYLPADSDFA